MVRLNLQLFAKLNTNTSIVDYLKSQGKDSSYSGRKKIAQELGISNYSGSYDQNVQMLKMLKQGSTTNTSAKNTSVTNTSASNVTGTPKATAINGVDQHLVDKANSSYTQSDNVTNAQNVANADRDNYKELASKPFEMPEAVSKAWEVTNGLLEQLSSGRTSYTDQIKDLMSQIQNREDFSYDVSEDTMFQQMLSSAMTSGQSAMMDTMGQASALTGGYASTYAQSAGNQAYNAYIQDAYDNLPQYYNMALEAYQMEGQDMYNQLAMLNDADATEFQRMYDSWSANFSNAQQMYQNEYGAWQDSINNAYNVYNTSQNYADTIYAQEYQKWADEVNNAMNYMNMQNNDYWTNQKFIEDQRQYNASLAEQKRQHNTSLAQSNAQFLAKNDHNGDGKVDNKDTEYTAMMEANAKAGNASGKEPNETQYGNALKYYNTAVASGKDSDWNAFEEYVDRLATMGIDTSYIESHVAKHGQEEKPHTSIFEKFFGK